MTFQRWRKKPVVVEAVQWDGTAEGATPIINWILENDGTATFYGPGEWDTSCLSATHLVIDTLEGRMLASPTDYIIRGVQGEFYPCKSDIFTETYEPEAMIASERLAAQAVTPNRCPDSSILNWGAHLAAERDDK